jgi:hypothetical protein
MVGDTSVDEQDRFTEPVSSVKLPIENRKSQFLHDYRSSLVPQKNE